MKRKKVKELFQAIEGISHRNPSEVYGVKTALRYKYADGSSSKPVNMLASSGKYCLPETQIIKKIITSIEPKKLPKEVTIINRLAGWPVLSLTLNHDIGAILLAVNTAHGIIAFDVHMNEDEEPVIAPDELKALQGWVKETEEEQKKREGLIDTYKESVDLTASTKE